MDKEHNLARLDKLLKEQTSKWANKQRKQMEVMSKCAALFARIFKQDGNENIVDSEKGTEWIVLLFGQLAEKTHETLPLLEDLYEFSKANPGVIGTIVNNEGWETLYSRLKRFGELY